MSKDETFPDDSRERAEGTVRERLEQGAERATEEFDEGIVDLLAWVLDTETRARIYVYLRKNPGSTSEEIAKGTGLYPSTVREALAELHEEEKVERSKRAESGAGNNPYEYTAMAPSELVGSIIGEVQDELNTVFHLDSYLTGTPEADRDPVRITVEDVSDSDTETGASSRETTEGTGRKAGEEGPLGDDEPEEEDTSIEEDDTSGSDDRVTDRGESDE